MTEFADIGLRYPSVTREHCKNMYSLMFGGGVGGTLPIWLESVLEGMERQYGSLRATSEFHSIMASMRAVENKPIEIFVVGEGKFGKSTLLNALLGARLSEVHFLPATRCFLRYVPKSEPTDIVKLFVRLQGDMHHWLQTQLPPAKNESEEIFGAQKICVSGKLADELIKEDARRCGKKDALAEYIPAIVEAEREVPIAHNASLPQSVRIVDTQGLNQIFAGEMNHLLDDISASTSAERFEQWMHSSPRGQHLDWQLRRCDVLLWLVHARKYNSAPTRAALRHFRRYGKSTVIAVTCIDQFQDTEVNRVLSGIHNEYGDLAAAICPVNAKAAMDSALQNNRDGVVQSGLPTLAKELQRHAGTNAAVTRATGAYLSLRQTEEQQRKAIAALRADMQIELNHIERDRARIQDNRQQTLNTINNRMDIIFQEERWAIDAVTREISRSWGESAIYNALDIPERSRAMQAKARLLQNEASDALQRLAHAISGQSYHLPSFDAEGDRANDSIKASFQLPRRDVRLAPQTLQLKIDPQIFRILEAAWDNFKGLFSEAAREESARKLRVFQEQINQEAINTLAEYRERWKQVLYEENHQAHGIALAEISNIKSTLESIEGRSLENSCELITFALSTISLPRALPTLILRSLTHRDENVHGHIYRKGII